MDLDGRTVAVLGAGKSGIAAAELLLSRAARVTLWDERPPEQLGAEELAARYVDDSEPAVRAAARRVLVSISERSFEGGGATA